MSTQNEIEHTYDLSNDFFKIWLDKKMNYSCGLHEGVVTEEDAQRQKLAWICSAAHVDTSKIVLDIGCGWGACLDYLIEDCKVKEAHGITLSKAQYSEIRSRPHPKIKVSHCSYLDYRPRIKYDALISIGMVEHIVSPKLVRQGLDIEVYRNFFKLAHMLTKPDSWFGLQLIHTARIPKNRQDLKDLVWGSRAIFPGAFAPRMEKLVQALCPYWEIIEIRNRRKDYEKTTTEWHRRLCLGEKEIKERWGNKVFVDYEKYLRTCIRMFQKGYFMLGQYSLYRRELL